MKEKFPQIRESLPTLNEFGDEQIMRIMNSMGSDYYWGYETANEQVSEGILILAHGVNDFADQILFNDVEPLTQDYTTSIAFWHEHDDVKAHILCVSSNARKRLRCHPCNTANRKSI